MTKGIYAIMDTVARELAGTVPLHVFAHPTAAIRFFGDVINSPNSGIGAHLDDYTLLELGTIDTETGAIIAHATPYTVITGNAWQAAQAKPGPTLEK